MSREGSGDEEKLHVTNTRPDEIGKQTQFVPRDGNGDTHRHLHS